MAQQGIQYPEYEPDALFRCEAGLRCGTFRRDRCHSHNGLLMCPICRYIATLVFTGKLERSHDH